MSLEPKDPPSSDPVPVQIVHPDPVPVVMAPTAEPIPVVLAPSSPPIPVRAPIPAVQSQIRDPSKAATTTFQQDLTALGQRNINVMWETTQRNIAQVVSLVSLIVTAFLVMWPSIPLELRLMAYTTLSNVFFAVTSVYFTRTNHTKTGGVGPNESGR